MSSQSGFLLGDPCIAQLISIIHEIQTAFDKNPTVEVRVVFLDISKAFDKVWHDDLLKRKQRVVLNGQISAWREIISGVRQGSVLGTLLFLTDINDLPDGIPSLCKIVADDTSLFSKVHNINKSVNELNANLKKISQWAYQWKMQFNPDSDEQANEVVFSLKSDSPNVFHPFSKRFPSAY